MLPASNRACYGRQARQSRLANFLWQLGPEKPLTQTGESGHSQQDPVQRDADYHHEQRHDGDED